MRCRNLSFLAIVSLAMGLSACNANATSQAEPDPAPAPRASGRPAIGSEDATNDLVGRAALAKDKHYIATYALNRAKGDTVDVTVSVAQDGSWRVDVPGGAHGGKADVTIVWTKQGYFQCVLGSKDTCVHVAERNESLPKAIDPMVQHVFTDWLDVFLDRHSPLSIAYTEPLSGAGKDSECFSLERNSVSVAAPIPASVYCIRADGTVTAVKSSFGSLKLSGEVLPATERTRLPAQVSNDKPLGTSAPPKPKPSPSPSKSADKDEKKDD